MSNTRKKAVRRRKRATPAHSDSAKAFPALIKSVLLSLPLTALVGVLLLLIATAVLLVTNDPDQYRDVAAPILLYITAAIGGAMTTLLHGRRSPALCGILTGLCLVVIIAVPALFLHGAGEENKMLTLLLRLLLIPTTTAGAFLATKKRKKRHRR